MNASIKKTVELLNISIKTIEDPKIRKIQEQLINLIEQLVAENEKLEKKNQKLQDENNHLKGEQGKPNIRKQSKSQSSNVSSENERKPRGTKDDKENEENKKRQSKKETVKPNRTEVYKLDKNKLPEDAIFKGYETTVVQDIIILNDNIELKRETYYSPSLKRSFTAGYPEWYDGEFGPNIRTCILDLHHDKKMTESAIHKYLTTYGVQISTASISRILTNGIDIFHKEKEEIIEAGLASSDYHQMDDTGARIKGKNHYAHILCNPFYTAYFTKKHKNRLTIIEILSQGNISFCIDDFAYVIMEKLHLSTKQLNLLKEKKPAEDMTRQEIDAFLDTNYSKKEKTIKRIILEAAAISGYNKSSMAIDILLADEAPQFKLITKHFAGCWVHDGRHYKKLNPQFDISRGILDNFLTKYWDFYHRLIDYKAHPNSKLAEELEADFDKLFSTQTAYQQLNERIEKTKQNKDSLLLVLKYPLLPLHNNASELGARSQARYRDISFHTMTEKGTQAKDTFMTIIETAKKLSVKAYDYIRDRVSKKFDMPSLASLIRENSAMRFNSI